MGTIRYFSGGREPSKRSFASELMRLEIQKKGKLDPGERYKMIMKKKFNESRIKLNSLAGSRQMTKRAEDALKQVAAKKAAKEAKALRRMVIIQPKNYASGRLTKKGQVQDIAGNIVANVNKKNGKMTTTTGWALGKYKKSYMTQLILEEAIQKYSPHYINLRKMQAMQQGLVPQVDASESSASMTRTQETILYGSMPAAPEHFDSSATYGTAAGGPRQNIGVTAWGAMSDNAWGTFADNVWGTSADTVWGTNMSDVWGGIGGNPFGGGGKSVQMWGTGNGKNHLSKITNAIAAFFGFKTQGQRNAFRQSVSAFRASRTSGRSGSSGGAGPTRSGGAPAATTRR